MVERKGVLVLVFCFAIFISILSFVPAPDLDPNTSVYVGIDAVGHLIELVSVSDTAVTLQMDIGDIREISEQSEPYTLYTHSQSPNLEIIVTDADEQNLELSATVLVGYEISLDAENNPTVNFVVDGVSHTVELISASDTAATIKIDDDSREIMNQQYTGPYHLGNGKKIGGFWVILKDADESNLELSATILVFHEKNFFVGNNLYVPNSCQDTENGINIYSKGSCIGPGDVAPMFDRCTGDYVSEYFCITDEMVEYCEENLGEDCNLGDRYACRSVDFIPEIINNLELTWEFFEVDAKYLCPYGCYDGACIEYSENEENCDLVNDDFVDADGDGCHAGLDSDCGGIEGVDDPEITCNDGIDNDCDGMVDENDNDLSCGGLPGSCFIHSDCSGGKLCVSNFFDCPQGKCLEMECKEVSEEELESICGVNLACRDENCLDKGVCVEALAMDLLLRCGAGPVDLSCDEEECIGIGLCSDELKDKDLEEICGDEIPCANAACILIGDCIDELNQEELEYACGDYLPCTNERCENIGKCIEDLEEDSCDGCDVDGNCYPITYRTKKQYCDVSGIFVDQMKAGSNCNNNFECKTNLCIDSECLDSGLWKKMMSFFKRLFTKN
jgi:hypothetical protein